MSNAMRFGKRSLAGVAAGALALGMLTIAAAPVATAQPSVKPKANVTASVTPVRATQTPESPTWTVANIDDVSYSLISWTTSGALAAGAATADVVLNAAPAAAAQVGMAAFLTAGNGTSATTSAGDIQNSTLTGTNVTSNRMTLVSTNVVLPANSINNGVAVAAGGTAYAAIAVNTPGTYRITLTTNSNGVAVDTVSISFTTSGKPSSVVFSPASSTTARTAPTPLSVAVLDAAGNGTQLSTVTTSEYVNLDSATGGTPTFQRDTSLADTTKATITTLNGAASTSLALGFTTGLTYANASAGSYTLTADPEGVLGTIAARSVTVLVSGEISGSVTYAKVVTPTLATNTVPNVLPVTSVVPAGSSTIKMNLQGTANATVRIKATPNAGTVNGASSSTGAFQNVTLDALGEGSVTWTLAGAALTDGNSITVTQVSATNVLVATLATVTQSTPAVSGGTIVLQPSGNVTAALGSQVPIAAAVLDQFDQPQANYTVRIYRTAISATNLVSTGTTGADGVAKLNVTNLASATSGSTETYVTQVQSPGGVYTTGTTYAGLAVTYTTSGAIGTLTVTTNPASTSAVMPAIRVPTDGLVDTGITTVTYNATTDTCSDLYGDCSLATEVFAFTPLTSPATNVVVTAPEGAKMSTSAPVSVSKNWNGGSTTLTVPSGTTIYAWTTKTDINEFKLVPFGQSTPTASVKALAVNLTTDGYTLTAAPSDVEIATLAFATVKVSIKDIFGNPVPFSSFSYTAEGPFLVGNEQTASWSTNAFGERSVVLNTLRDQGEGKLTVRGSATNTAWAPGYVKPPGVTADPVRTAEVKVKVSDQAIKSIAIVGSRGTVSGKPGIIVDGTTTGLAGKTVIPYVRFPGGEYTQGTARPKVSAAGDFEWSRKTGKKAYVYFTNDDGKISSNRIIIAAS